MRFRVAQFLSFIIFFFQNITKFEHFDYYDNKIDLAFPLIYTYFPLLVVLLTIHWSIFTMLFTLVRFYLGTIHWLISICRWFLLRLHKML